jgi:hypothetical protein
MERGIKMLEKKYFINQFQDITPTKFMRRQQFLRRKEGKLIYKSLLEKRRRTNPKFTH